MPLEDVLEKLYARRRFGIRPGVDRVGELLRRLGTPEKQFRTIHVVGTNGKGSSSAFLSSILLSAGHSVAQFSSPHLVRFTERFRINGAEFPAEKLADCLETVLQEAPEEATFFEITTALAAYVFSAERVAFAVMEAGMGGRSDATAAFDGELTIITPIALDHTGYLGATVEAIAEEKAGIIKPGTPVISAGQSDAARRAIEAACRAGQCPLRTSGTDFSVAWNRDGGLDYRGLHRTLTGLRPGITGQYQSGNAAIALAAAELLAADGLAIPPAAFREGIAGAYWPGRMELVPGSPPLLLVTGVCDDKDIDLIYAPLVPLADAIYTVTPAVERAMNAEDLSHFFQTQGVASHPCGSVAEGISRARSHAAEDDLILVCGSLFVVGEVKAWLEQTNYTGIRG